MRPDELITSWPGATWRPWPPGSTIASSPIRTVCTRMRGRPLRNSPSTATGVLANSIFGCTTYRCGAAVIRSSQSAVSESDSSSPITDAAGETGSVSWNT